MSLYEFSSPIVVSPVAPKVGAPMRMGWPEQGRRLNYKYTGLGDPKLGKQYKYTGLERADYHYTGLGRQFGPDTPAVPTAADASQASAQVTDLISRTVGGSARATAVAGQVRTWVNLLTGLATIGTTIGSAAGGDADAIRVANMVIGWIRAIGNGQIPAVQISPSDLPGFVNYCQNIKPIIEGGLIGGYSLATTAIQTTNGGRGDANAQAALDTIVMWIMGGPGGGGGILNAICTLPQIQAAIQAAQAAAVPDCAGSIPNSQWNAAAGTCECMPGYSSAIQPGQCLPDSSASGSTQPSRFLNPALTRIVPSNTFRVQMQQCPDGSFIPRGGQCPQTGGGSAPSGPSGLLVVGVLAALGIGAYAYANR